MKRDDKQIYHLLKTVYAFFEMNQIFDAYGKNQKGSVLHERIGVALGEDAPLPEIMRPRPPLTTADLDTFSRFWAYQLQQIYPNLLPPLKKVKTGNSKALMTAAAITGLLFISRRERESDEFAELVRGLVDHPKWRARMWMGRGEDCL